MNCPKCGNSLEDSSQQCTKCGAVMSVAGSNPFSMSSGENPPMGGEVSANSEKKRSLRSTLMVGGVVVLVAVLSVVGTLLVVNNNSSSSSSPKAVAAEFTNDLINGQYQNACELTNLYVADECQAFLSNFNGVKLSGSVTAGNDYIDGTEAVVNLIGKICDDSDNSLVCQSNSDPNYSIPTSHSEFNSFWTDSTVTGGNGKLAILSLIEVNGSWIVYLHPNQYGGNFHSTPHDTVPQSNLGNAIIEANAIYTQDNQVFGQNVGSIANELQTMEPSITFKFASSANQTGIKDVNTVSVAPFECVSANGKSVIGIDTNPSDFNCQAVVLLDYDLPSEICYIALVDKDNSGPTANILGEPVPIGGGTYYSAIKTKYGCSLAINIKPTGGWDSGQFPTPG